MPGLEMEWLEVFWLVNTREGFSVPGSTAWKCQGLGFRGLRFQRGGGVCTGWFGFWCLVWNSGFGSSGLQSLNEEMPLVWRVVLYKGLRFLVISQQ